MAKKISVLMSLTIILLLSSCGKYYSKYEIVDVEMKQINIEDSSDAGRKYYLLSFKIELCCPEIRFFTGPGVEPGLNGINHEITNICISNDMNKDITVDFQGWDFRDEMITDGINSYSFQSYPSISELILNINSCDPKVTGLNIKNPFLFYTETEDTPTSISIKIGSRHKSNTIDNEISAPFTIVYLSNENFH